MPSSKHYEHHKGDGTMDIYGHDFACTFRVPRESVLHLPAQRLNITRLVACKNFSTAVDEARGARLNDEQWCLSACKMGNRCKFVHVSRPLSEFPNQALHAHYIWRSVEDVTYDRLVTAEKEGSGGDDVCRLTLHPCALCATQVNMCFNMLGDANVSTGDGSLPPPITRPTPKTPVAVVVSAEGAAAVSVTEGKKDGEGDTEAAVVVPPRPPVDPEVRALYDGLMLDVVAATLSTMEVPVTRFLKTFGATRALNSIRGERQEGEAATQQHHLQACYEFACENECKKGPDCDKAHVINVDPTLEVPFVRRSMRHVKAAVSSMHRGPPHGDLKPAPHIVAKLLEDEFCISKEDVELVSEANRADPAAYSQPAPLAAEPQPNPYRLSKAHPLRKGLPSNVSSAGKVPRGEAPQYAPYPSTMYMSSNPLQALFAGGCDFVVTPNTQPQQQYYGNNNTPENSPSGHHIPVIPPTYANNNTTTTTPVPQMGMCIQYPPYLLADPAPAEQYQDSGHDRQMARLVDDVIGPSIRQQSQPALRSIANSNSNNNSSSTVGDSTLMSGVHPQQQHQLQSWSPFSAGLNWQQQHHHVQQLPIASTSQGSSSSSNNYMVQQHHYQQGYVAPQQQHYSTHHHQMSMQPPQHQQHQQQHHPAMMYSMPYPFNSGGQQMQFVTPAHHVGGPNSAPSTSTATSQPPQPYTTMVPGYHHIPTQLGQH